MNFFDHIREVFGTIRKNPLRTLLTSFSIFWGIFVLIVLLAGGSGIQNRQLEEFRDDAVNSIWISTYKTSLPYRGLPVGRRVNMTNEDYDLLREVVPEAEYVTSRHMIRGANQIQYKKKSGSYEIRSVHPDHQYLEMTEIVTGRFINDLDIAEERKVTVLSLPVVQYLFEEEEPIGKWVNINDIPFKVIGTFTDQGGQFEENKVYLPISTAQKAYSGGDKISRLMFTLGDMTLDESRSVSARLRSFMSAKHDFDPLDMQAIYMRNNLESFARIQSLFFTINAFIWFIGIMSLVAGIVGVSNIMIISVKERVREIGIRKAIGATPFSVVNIILQESLFITLFSGLLGIAAGYGLINWFNSLIESNEEIAKVIKAPTVEPWVIFSALGFLLIFGTIAGLVPAIRAARIKPVEVLRED